MGFSLVFGFKSKMCGFESKMCGFKSKMCGLKTKGAGEGATPHPPERNDQAPENIVLPYEIVNY